MKKICAIILAVCMSISLTACGGQGGTSDHYTWNVAINNSESTLNYKFYEVFKEKIEAQSEGTVTVNLYANGQLGGDAEQLLSLIDGTVDFSTTVTSSMTSTIPAYGLFDLPNAFTDVQMMRQVEDDPDLMAALNAASAQKGIHLLGVADAGFRELSTNVEVRSPSDLPGMKIRVIDNPYHQAYWNALGCATTTMDFNEVYSSLQQKVIDAQENPYMNICANRFYEVQDYVVETNHLGHIMVFTMNQKLYDELPDDVRDLVDSCAAEALLATREAADAAISDYKATIEGAGKTIIDLDADILMQMKDKAAPVYDLVRSDLGDDMVDIFMNAVAKAQ